MLAVGMSPENLAVTLADAGPEVSVAAINSPSAVTLSGDSKALEDMAAQMDMFGVFHKFLPVSVPYHSHYMDPLRTELEKVWLRCDRKPRNCPFTRPSRAAAWTAARLTQSTGGGTSAGRFCFLPRSGR